MRKFIKKICLFAALLFAFYAVVFVFDSCVVGNQYLGSYQAALIDKAERLRSVEGSKIILIGNSNVCFGMDSKLIEDQFHMPVVDMGLHGGLGNAFHERMIYYGLSAGDIVVICHSSFSDDGSIGDPDLAWITLEHHAELWQIVEKKDLLPLFWAFPSYFHNLILNMMLGWQGNVAREDSCYSRSAFNEYGDIAFRPAESYTFTEESVNVPEINDTCVSRLNQLNRYIEEQGATMLVAGYPIGYGEYTPDASEFDTFEQKLRQALDCDVISHYTDYFLPYELFYNTKLHLTAEGAEIRTKQFISDLSAWMQDEGAAR